MCKIRNAKFGAVMDDGSFADAFAGCKYRRPKWFTTTLRLVDNACVARRAGASFFATFFPRGKKVDKKSKTVMSHEFSA